MITALLDLLAIPIEVGTVRQFLSGYAVFCTPFLVGAIVLARRHPQFWGVLVGNALAIGVSYLHAWLVLPSDRTATATVGSLAAGMLLYEFIMYWSHRLNHWSKPLWYLLHYSHHKSTSLGLHIGPISPILYKAANFSLKVYLVHLALDIPWVWAFQLGALNLNLQFFSHSKWLARLDLGPLEYVLNTPAAHAIHHARNPALLDKNFGGLILIWDILFGTFVHGPTALRTMDVVYGVANDPSPNGGPLSFALGGEQILLRRLFGRRDANP